MARCSGGVYFYTNATLTAGMKLSSGSSTWVTLSDRNLKRNIRPVDVRDVLFKLSKVPISQWSYKAQDPSIEHIGPMAQDFYAAFGLDEDDRHISTVDADGVALAAIQGLYEIIQERDVETAELRVENSALRQRVDDLEARLKALEAAGSQQWILLEICIKLCHMIDFVNQSLGGSFALPNIPKFEFANRISNARCFYWYYSEGMKHGSAYIGNYIGTWSRRYGAAICR